MANEPPHAREDDQERQLPPEEPAGAEPGEVPEPADSDQPPELPEAQDAPGTATWTPHRGLLAKTIAWVILAVLALCLVGGVAILLVRAL
jgi:hypothetical protein